MTRRDRPDASQSEDTSTEAWEEPQLVIHGDLQTLTKAGDPGAADSMGGDTPEQGLSTP